MSLLPTTHEDFKTKQYWDNFFKQRNNEAFEWYGEFDEISTLFDQLNISKTATFLVIGCGNSNFSSCLYDRGYHNITNIDFSDVVITEMQSKNVQRRHMKWEVGDMTQMSNYIDNSFDFVFDKGALDAMFSVDSMDVREKVQLMFNEIVRVLKSTNGRYICVSLLEQYILKDLLAYFVDASTSTVQFSTTIYPITQQKVSPFIPLFVDVQLHMADSTTTSNASTTSTSNTVTIQFDQFGNETAASTTLSTTNVCEVVFQVQQYHQKYHFLGNFELHRFETIQLYSVDIQEIPRFTLFVLDALAVATLSCAVFIVPFGRESEFQFSTAEGLTTIAEQANCRRLYAVCCNRPHSFPDTQALQAELSPIINSIKLKRMLPNEQIPYMMLNTDSDWSVLANGRSAVSGRYVVEQQADDDNDTVFLRRLIFLQNQNFIQTEVRLKVASNNNNSKKANSVKKKKNGKGSKATNDNVVEFDYSYLDDHHRAFLCSLLLTSVANNNNKGHFIHNATQKTNAANGKSANGNVASGLIIGLGGGALISCLQRYLPSCTLTVCDIDSEMEVLAKEFFGFRPNSRCQVIAADGLAVLDACEIQLLSVGASNIAVATNEATVKDFSHTTATATTNMTSNVADVSASVPFDFIIIDADSKDTSLGMSAPPQAFVGRNRLLQMYSLLRDGGLLLINVVARSKAALSQLEQQIVDTLVTPFATTGISSSSCSGGSNKLYKIQPSQETVNICLVLMKGVNSDSGSSSGSGCGSGSGSGSNRDKSNSSLPSRRILEVQCEKLLEQWLQSVNLNSDPLKLVEIVELIREVC